MRLVTVFGTRPEIIRLSLVFRKLQRLKISNVLVHTGQNYDRQLSKVFFDEMGVSSPHYYLGIRSKTIGEQIGSIIHRIEGILLKEQPDIFLVLGDTNSGLAAITAARHRIPIAHMEAGNRCFDWSVPEEKNRKIIDHISDWLFPYTAQARENLIREGIHPSKVIVTGNPITEILQEWAEASERNPILSTLKLKPKEYFLATSHREENVDDPDRLSSIIEGLRLVGEYFHIPVVWSVHPRTRRRIKMLKKKLSPHIIFHRPFSFFEFIKLEKNALCVITDSGTVQEEASLFKVPAVTIRETTERPETVECGSNILSGVDNPSRILECVRLMARSQRQWISPYEGDGGVSDRMVQFLISHKKSLF